MASSATVGKVPGGSAPTEDQKHALREAFGLVCYTTGPGGGVVFDPTVGEAITGIAGVRASSRVESGAQGWTLLDLWTGITSTDAAVRLRGDQYEFSGTLSGAITTGKKLATLPLGLPKPRASAVPCVASSGVVGITVKEDGSVFAGTIGAETTWVVLDALTSRLGQSETRPSLIIPTLPVIRLELGGITLLPPAADTYFPGTISVEPNGFDIPGTAGPVAVTVSGHGNSTWSYSPKKSMRLKFSSATSVMGFPAEKTYRLLANYFDQTFVRNGMAFEIARRTFNMWTPKVAMCEVFVYGVYQGVYQLAEPVKASANRLQITPSKTATAPSKTRRDRSTSIVKSTCPGVSIILMRCSTLLRVQKQVVAADVIVIPRSCSCSIQSIVAVPS